VKFERAVIEICELTDRQTDTMIAILHTPIASEVNIPQLDSLNV